MEVIVILTLCAALGVLSVRYGYDSRDGVGSKDQDLASRGVTWAGLAHRQERADASEALLASRLVSKLAKAEQMLGQRC